MNFQFLTPDVLRLVARKIAVPLAMLVMVGGLIYYFTGELEQDNLRRQFTIDSLDWSIAETTERIATIDQELGVIREKGRRYDEILLTGFAAPQQRLLANQLIEELGRKHQLAAVSYNFNPEIVDEIRGESGVEFVISQTEVSIDVSAFTDYDIFGFVAEFAERLEGQVQILALQVTRTSEITDELLRQVADGSASRVFSGTFRLRWNNVTTISSEDDELEP